MGRRITDLDSPEFGALFTGFRHTAYRLETLQRYDVRYEIESYRDFLAGKPRPHDTSKNAWTAMLTESVAAGKIFQRVHLVVEPLTDYLRYELEWSYPPNIQAGEDVRILPAGSVRATQAAQLSTLGDYWLFDSIDLWVMKYDRGRFLAAEQVPEFPAIIAHTAWRDAALHWAIPYADYMRRRELLRAS